MTEEERRQIAEDDENMKKILDNIQERCPVNIYNYDMDKDKDAKLVITGMYLMWIDQRELKELFKKYTLGFNNLKDTSVLFFDRHHILELMSILHGIFHFPILRQEIDDYYYDRWILKFARYIDELHNYCDLVDFINNMVNDLKEHNPKCDYKIFNRVRNILFNVWLIPYSKIDEIVKEAIAQYKKETEGEDNNG